MSSHRSSRVLPNPPAPEAHGGGGRSECAGRRSVGVPMLLGQGAAHGSMRGQRAACVRTFTRVRSRPVGDGRTGPRQPVVRRVGVLLDRLMELCGRLRDDTGQSAHASQHMPTPRCVGAPGQGGVGKCAVAGRRSVEGRGGGRSRGGGGSAVQGRGTEGRGGGAEDKCCARGEERDLALGPSATISTAVTAVSCVRCMVRWRTGPAPRSAGR